MQRYKGISTVLVLLIHPLVLMGVLVALFFGVLTALIESGIFPQLAQRDAAPIVHKLLDYGLIVGLVVVLSGFALQFYELSRGKPIVAPTADYAAGTAQRNRQRMLAKVRHMWIEGVLEQSLYQVARIKVGLSEEPEAIEHPWKLVVQQPERAPRVLPDGAPMRAVFDDFDQTLLLLGAPGSGKTTLLLELARDLIARAKDDSSYPIPVVFNLSSWALRRPSLAAWLIDELNERYDVPRKVAHAWVDNDQILPLLDGLDEVTQEHRDACVEAINAFRTEHGLLPLAAASRIAEYEVLSERLRLTGAVVIQPLTRMQIDAYLAHAGAALSGVRAAVGEDETLWELLNTPLMLSILRLAFRKEDGPTSLLLAPGSAVERRARLFDAYIEAMFTRRAAASPYMPQQTRHWLSWLAQVMVSNDQTVFYLERLQLDWLPKTQTQAHGIAGSLVTGLLYGLGVLFGGLIGWLISMLDEVGNELVDALIGAMTGGILWAVWIFARRPIHPVEALHWSRKKISETLLAWIFGGLPLGLMFGVFFGLGVGLYAMFSGDWEVPRDALPQSDGPIARLLMMLYGVFGGLIIGLLFGLFGCLLGSALNVAKSGWSRKKTSSMLGIWLPRGLILGLFLGIAFGLLRAISGSLHGGMIAVLGAGPLARALVGLGAYFVLTCVAGIAVGLFFGLVGGLIAGFFVGVVENDISTRTIPNEGMRRSLRNAIGSGLIFWLVFGLTFWLFHLIFGMFPGGLHVVLSFSGILALAFSLKKGGYALIQHGVLRVLMWRYDYGPLDYIRFLEHAKNLLFLRRVGGGYIFVHRLMMEHFARIEEPIPRTSG